MPTVSVELPTTLMLMLVDLFWTSTMTRLAAVAKGARTCVGDVVTEVSLWVRDLRIGDEIWI